MKRFEVVETTYAPQQCMAPHVHEHASVSLVLRGGVEEDAEGLAQRAGCLAVAVKPAGVRHADRFGREETRLFTLRWLPDGPWGRYGWRREPRVLQVAVGLLRSFRLGEGRGQLIEHAERLRRALDGLEPWRNSTAMECQRPHWLDEAHSHMEVSRGTVRPGDLARRVGVHPVTLARVYRKHHGVTPREQLQRLRLEHAAEHLVRGRESLGAVAVRTGFADQAHLTRTVRQRTGLTPRQLRRCLAGG